MEAIKNNIGYRKDIDGLRGYSVLAVVIFHFGFLPNGFLGVDVFFVISGFLITNLIYQKILNGEFSILDFYIRRTRRIIPLVLFICLISLILGIVVMLPDDLDNLAQSVFATIFFNNNTLQAITTKDYWDVVNEFKPLMHTWSLAVEEQYYLFYPCILLLISKISQRLILPIFITLTLISISLFFLPFQEHIKFYYLPFRFFEFSIGGIAAIFLKGGVIKNKFSSLFIILLIVIFCLNFNYVNKDLLLFITVIISCFIIITDNKKTKISIFLLENKFIVFIGKISFSIYMWHQLILAFGKYFVFYKVGLVEYIIISVLIIFLSITSFYLIEKPFRYKFKTKTTLFFVVFISLVLSILSLYIYNNSGVLRDVNELGLKVSSINKETHSKYNDRIFKWDRPFTNSKKRKILVIGNSFARDWCNVLLESKFNATSEISYISNASTHSELLSRANDADFIFLTELNINEFSNLLKFKSKIWYVGTKNFGINNGYFYNNDINDYCLQRTVLENGYVEKNYILKKEWNDRYIDLIGLVIDNKNTVPVFTPACKFISQDCRHFTEYGAKYFAVLIENSNDFVLNGLGN